MSVLPSRRHSSRRQPEVCEGSTPEDPCGPVVAHDAELIPLCARCLKAMNADYARQPNCETCNGRVMLFDGQSCPDCTDGKDWSKAPHMTPEAG